MNPSFKPLILLTNDDGYFSSGIKALASALRDTAEVFIVAPDRERSAHSLSLSLRHPLRVKKTGPKSFATDGTPADCVYLAVKNILPRSPDLLISGMNPGPNLGRQDVSYSGTVAAAIQGSYFEIPSLAVSLLPDDSGSFAYSEAADFARTLSVYLLNAVIPSPLTLNVNIPHPPFRGVRITTLGRKGYETEIIEKKDPRGESYFWIGARRPRASKEKASDMEAVAGGCISITPLHTDLTDYEMIRNPLFGSGKIPIPKLHSSTRRKRNG